MEVACECSQSALKQIICDGWRLQNIIYIDGQTQSKLTGNYVRCIRWFMAEWQKRGSNSLTSCTFGEINFKY